MSGAGPQRIDDIGAIRVVVYALLVGGAAYLIAATYGPTGWEGRLPLAVLLAVGYAAIVGAVGVLRRRTPAK